MSADNFNPIKEKKTKGNRWWNWVGNNHRLLVMNDVDFKEAGAMRLTARNVALVTIGVGAIWLLTTVAALRLFGGGKTAAITAEVANYTPDQVRSQLIAIHGQLDSLYTEIDARDVYIEKIQAMLNSNLETEKDVKAKREQLAELQAKDTTPRVSKAMPEKSDAVKNMQQMAKAEQELNGDANNNPNNSGANPVGAVSSALISADMMISPRLDQFTFVSPLRGIVSDTFSAKNKHYGVDVVAPKGAVIKATQGGTVIVSTWSADTGHMLAVQHPNNIVSFYKHNSSLLKKQGDQVNAGEAIAIIGNSGELTDGPHLHFELWFHGQPVNPQRYMQF
jgi:murein DD-endopeptidase MepM/ murein hydrolase activator NlpD